MELTSPVDLGGATSATLRFWARWDISQIRDLLEVSASADGSLWTPLCGIRTRPGSYFQETDVPVFEGRQFEWVQEELSLDAFVGDDVLLRFRLLSQMDFTRDGFYLDDLEVLTTEETTSGTSDPGTASGGLMCAPNPAMDRTTLHFMGRGLGTNSRLVIFDAVGATVRELPFNTRSQDLQLVDLTPGLYTCMIRDTEGSTACTRLMVVRP